MPSQPTTTPGVRTPGPPSEGSKSPHIQKVHNKKIPNSYFYRLVIKIILGQKFQKITTKSSIYKWRDFLTSRQEILNHFFKLCGD